MTSAPPRVSRLIDAPRSVSAVTTETSQRLVRAELSEQSFDLGGVTLTRGGHFHRPHIQGLGIDGQMDLAHKAGEFKRQASRESSAIRTPRILRVGVLLAALVASFLLGCIVAAKKGWLQPIVAVTIVNKTGQKIERLSLDHKSLSSEGTVNLQPLAPGERVVARFYQAGEGIYTISALLADGKSLIGQAGYVESGYSVTEVLAQQGAQQR